MSGFATAVESPLVHSYRGLHCHDLTLPDGLRLLVLPAHGVPTVEVRLNLPFARHRKSDAAAMELLSAVLLAAEGHRVSELLADHGGECEVVLDAENLTFGAGALADGLPEVLYALASALRNPDHTIDRLDRAREGLLRSRPVDPPVIRGWSPPPPASVGELLDVTADRVMDVHRRVLRPETAVLCIAGDIDVDTVVALAGDAFSGWRGVPSTESPLDLPPRFFPESPLVERAIGTGEGTHLALEAPSVPLWHPDHAALHLANLMVAGCFTGRLVRRLRDREGLAYTVRSTLHKLRRSDWISISCSGPLADPDELLESTEETLAELAGSGPYPGELDAVRGYAVGVNRTAARGTSGMAHAVTAYAAHGVSPLWMLEAGERYAGVEEGDIHRVLAAYFAPDHFGGVLTEGRSTSAPSERIEGADS